MRTSRFKIFFRIAELTLLFLILGLGFWIPQGYTQNAPESPPALNSPPVISMDFKDASLKDVLKAFSIQAGTNFIASQEIEDRTVTLYLDKVSVKEAMDNLFKANNLGYEFVEEAKIMLVEKADPEIKTITKIFPLKYAHVSTSSIQEEMSSAISPDEGGGGGGGGDSGKWSAESESGITYVIKKLLKEADGESIMEDARTNSLIITALPSKFPIIEKTIKELDIPVPQVMLEVEMLDVSKNLVDKLGFNFGDNPITLMLPGGLRHLDFTIAGSGLSEADITNKEGKRGAINLGSTYRAVLDFLHTQTDTKFLARPRILTLDNETAEIGITTEEAIGESVTLNEAGAITGRTPERTTTGVSLRITPQVNLETGEITMFVVPQVTEAAEGSFIGQGGFAYRNPEERAAKCLVKLRDGETIVVGGLIRRDKSEVVTKIPILGDIPIIGALFRRRYKSKDTDRELLVFITPRIVKDTFAPLAKDSSGMVLPSREQDIPLEEKRLLSIETTLNSLNNAAHY